MTTFSTTSADALSSATDSSGSTAPLADQPPTDFDGNGVSDILWYNTNGDTGIWYLTSTGGLTPVDLGVSDTSWTPQATGDFNADGKADILWRNTSGEVGEWLANGGAGATGFTAVDLGHVDQSWAIQGTGDFNGDGASDILWRNTSGDTGIWYSNGNGAFTATDLGLVDTSWSVQQIGDFNGDNRSDIFWRNTSGEVGEWLSNGGTGIAGFTAVDLGVVSSSWLTQGVGDFNGAGASDILWRNSLTGDVGIWFMNNGVPTAQDLGPVDLGWTIQGVGDYNGDGKADILWRNASGQVGEWLSNAGAGFTGFTAVLLPTVDASWSVVGANAPITPSAARMAQAMATMGAQSAAPALTSAAAHETANHPMIAAPALKYA